MVQLDRTADYRRQIEESFAQRPRSRSRTRAPEQHDLNTTEEYCRRMEEYFKKRSLARMRRCSPAPWQIDREPSSTSSALPASIQTVQSVQQIQEEPPVCRIPNNQTEPENDVERRFNHNSRVQVSRDDEIIIENQFPSVSELRHEEYIQPRNNNNQGVIQNAVQSVEQYVPLAPNQPAAYPAPTSSNVAPARSPRSSMFLSAVMPPPARPLSSTATSCVRPPRPIEQNPVPARRPDQPMLTEESCHYPIHGLQSPYSRRPPNSNINFPAPQMPMPPKSMKEDNERLSREQEKRMHRNFLVPVSNTDIAPVVSEYVCDVDGFLEQHHREIMAPRRRSSSTSSYASLDQSTWVEEEYADHISPLPAAHVDELLLDIDEPILAPSVKAYVAPQVSANNFTRAAETTSRPPLVLPMPYHIQKVAGQPVPTQAPVQNSVPAQVAPVGQRPLSKSLVSKRRSPQPSLKKKTAARLQEPPISFMQGDLQVYTVSSPRVGASSRRRDIPARVSSKPIRQSSSSIRPLSESLTNSLTSSLWNSSPETTTSHGSQRIMHKQAQPQVLRTIQNLPTVGMHDITDIWGLEDETTASFEPTCNFGQSSPQQQPTSILGRQNVVSTEQVACNQEEEFVPINVSLLTPESLDGMDDEQLEAVVDAMFCGTPRDKYKQTYPYLAEGVVQKDDQLQNKLRVFSSRVGKVYIPDSPARGNKDYVYFLVAREGDYRGFTFHPHPRSLVSAKFPNSDQEKIVIRGYAILGHANYKKSDVRAEERWVCWNDSMGMMKIYAGAARISLKKHPDWDKPLDVVSISSTFENNSFVVTRVTVLTNVKDKKEQFPEEVFLVQDMIYKTMVGDDLIFYSLELDLTVSMKNTLIDNFSGDTERKYEIVVVPTFPCSTRLEFKGILLIDNPMFWSRDKEWVREKLLKRTDDYKIVSMTQRKATSPLSENPGNCSGTSNSRDSRAAKLRLPTKSK